MEQGMSRVNRLTDHGVSQAVAEDGTAIAYEDIGHGEPLVLLYGLTESSGSWHEAGDVEQFLQRRRRLIVVDDRGHGQSGKPHASLHIQVASWYRSSLPFSTVPV
jgi:pimeloyl-ACP methyl ester carboxylesterase